MLGSTEILVIGGVVLVLFGAGAIPKFARSLGRARKEFEAGVADEEAQNSQKAVNEGEKTPTDEPTSEDEGSGTGR